MDEVIQNMMERRSNRAYKAKPVPRELVEKVIEAGLWAPSGMGRQSPIVVAVTKKELRDRLADANRRIMGAPEGTDPFYGAPVVLVVLADRARPTHVYDGSLTIGNMLNAAHSLGLGSCWIHRAKEEFDEPEFKSLLAELGVTGDYEGIGHVILGYAADEPKAPARRPNRVFWAE
jgi:nitroreductase